MIYILIILLVLAVLLVFYGISSLVFSKLLNNNLTKLANLLAGLLGLQYILGMLSNLYVKIPDIKPYEVFHAFNTVLLHTINATFILMFAFIFLLNTRKKKIYQRIGIIGFISVLTSYLCGIIFVNAGQNDVYSFIMSLGFLIAILSYFYTIIDSRLGFSH